MSSRVVQFDESSSGEGEDPGISDTEGRDLGSINDPMDEDIDDEDDNSSGGNPLFQWEKEYHRTWDDVQEDETGRLAGSVTQGMERNRRLKSRRANTGVVRRGMVRALCLIVDLSKSVAENDFKPNRLRVIVNNVESFVREYFDQNPVSQLCILVTRQKKAVKLTELSGNPARHIAALTLHLNQDLPIHMGEEISMQNALELAKETLSFVPNHASKEIVFLLASLSTCDPETDLQGRPVDIHGTIDSVARAGIRVSVLGIGAELFLCNVLCDKCNGEYNVAFSEQHYKELLREQVHPPPTIQGQEALDKANLIRMGFPEKKVSANVSLCSCHGRLTREGYTCPRCEAKVCELPVDCPVCQRSLVSSPHLARSYHHLFPIPAYKEVAKADQTNTVSCTCCDKTLTPGTQLRLACPSCDSPFCVECDIYIHEGGLSPCKCTWA